MIRVAPRPIGGHSRPIGARSRGRDEPSPPPPFKARPPMRPPPPHLLGQGAKPPFNARPTPPSAAPASNGETVEQPTEAERPLPTEAALSSDSRALGLRRPHESWAVLCKKAHNRRSARAFQQLEEKSASVNKIDKWERADVPPVEEDGYEVFTGAEDACDVYLSGGGLCASPCSREGGSIKSPQSTDKKKNN